MEEGSPPQLPRCAIIPTTHPVAQGLRFVALYTNWIIVTCFGNWTLVPTLKAESCYYYAMTLGWERWYLLLRHAWVNCLQLKNACTIVDANSADDQVASNVIVIIVLPDW